ncbi:MAG TPA: methyltransferase domain-containing protein [Anaerolineae bacterium]|nr:methyltransferase domain-containing protein [Anaerolineae bacterium]HOQ98296.1 methyltransferase domain-containing protein [Anaerolineae bacterium]HPL28565.1 methyltransferase domain-containing protein [Anaerolineae bacterium]
MLDLERQERLRARYAAATPGWQAATMVYDALVRAHIGPEAAILDAGCGQAGIVARARGRARAVGFDATFAGYHGAVDLTDLVCGNLEALPFADRSFTLIASSWVFEHLARPERAFAEFARVLAPGGRLVFLTPNAHNYVTVANRLAPTRLQKALVWRLYRRAEAYTFRTHYRANTHRDLDRLLSAAGFRREALHYVGDPTYLAFNELGYRLGVLLERLTDHARLQQFKVHLVGVYQRP